MNNKIIFPILLFLSINLISCAQSEKDVEVKITKDSCSIWKLPQISFSVRIPKDYIISYHPSGGFYFQAHKFINGELICELTFGQINGDIDSSNLVDMLAEADSEARKQFKEIKQTYKTHFIGVDKIAEGLNVPQLRNYIEFKDFNSKMNGQYRGLTVPIIFNAEDKFMFSSLLRVNQEFNDKEIGKEIIKVLESIQIENK